MRVAVVGLSTGASRWRRAHESTRRSEPSPQAVCAAWPLTPLVNRPASMPVNEYARESVARPARLRLINSRYTTCLFDVFLARDERGKTMARITRDRWMFLGWGLSLGLVVAWFIHDRTPSIALYASATQGVENFAIATGMIHSGVEGLYFLDFTTGDLKASVLNPKTGKFNSIFSHNILQDFGPIKNPKYLIVTGQVNMPRGRAPFQYAQSIVYVAEVTTGQVMA